MTTQTCFDFCVTENGRALFGLEYGGECYCGDALATGSAPTFSSSCSTCGGGNRLSLHGTGPDPPAAALPPGLPPVTTFQYLGCFREPDGTRALAGPTAADGTAMTVESCGNFCLYGRFLMFGAEYASECYCGSELDSGSGMAPEEDCGVPCSGDPTQMCGGGNRISLYTWAE
ncbi:putative fungistatic metabolite [Phialemonium atrogriseum]|uniref:Fungistatic metabolite n=1 Tax=Phialemonium atrogriseum TaxID=1093897 RepID=A0AAJ0C8N4_9PEZI|nr:putative fungistatic metabolite [Phialemonium atrogriseum]KAK1769731.1 putative fungistatic metabolite [Phialemonium atrogriseum]